MMKWNGRSTLSIVSLAISALIAGHAAGELVMIPNSKESPPGSRTVKSLASFAGLSPYALENGAPPDDNVSKDSPFQAFARLTAALNAKAEHATLPEALRDMPIGRVVIVRDAGQPVFGAILGVDVPRDEAYVVREYADPQWLTLETLRRIYAPECLILDIPLTPQDAPLWHAGEGRVMVGELEWRSGQSRDLTLFNRSDAPVRLVGSHISCPSGEVVLPSAPIGPGEYCRLTLNIDAEKRSEGGFVIDVTLQTDRRGQPEISTLFLGQIKSSVPVEPTLHDLGRVSASAKPIAMTSHIDFGESYAGGLEPIPASGGAIGIDTVEKVAPGRFRVIATLDPAKLPRTGDGRFVERASLTSESENARRVDIGAVGTFIPSLQAFPAALYAEAATGEAFAAEVRVAHVPGAAIEPVVPEGLRLLHAEAVSNTETRLRFGGQAPKAGLQEWTIVLRGADGSEFALPCIVRVR